MIRLVNIGVLRGIGGSEIHRRLCQNDSKEVLYDVMKWIVNIGVLRGIVVIYMKCFINR